MTRRLQHCPQPQARVSLEGWRPRDLASSFIVSSANINTHSNSVRRATSSAKSRSSQGHSIDVGLKANSAHCTMHVHNVHMIPHSSPRMSYFCRLQFVEFCSAMCIVSTAILWYRSSISRVRKCLTCCLNVSQVVVSSIGRVRK